MRLVCSASEATGPASDLSLGQSPGLTVGVTLWISVGAPVTMIGMMQTPARGRPCFNRMDLMETQPIRVISHERPVRRSFPAMSRGSEVDVVGVWCAMEGAAGASELAAVQSSQLQLHAIRFSTTTSCRHLKVATVIL